jgi:hypothetical protein
MSGAGAGAGAGTGGRGSADLGVDGTIGSTPRDVDGMGVDSAGQAQSRGESAVSATTADRTGTAKSEAERVGRETSGADDVSQVAGRGRAVEGEASATASQAERIKDDPSGVANDRVTAEGQARVEGVKGEATASAHAATPERAREGVASAEQAQREVGTAKGKADGVAAAADDPQGTAEREAEARIREAAAKGEGEHGVRVSVGTDGAKGDAD